MGASDVLFITLSHSVSFLGENELVGVIGSAHGEISRGREVIHHG